MTTDMTSSAGSPSNLTDNNGKISLEVLAKMTGFPIEMIKEEIFQGQEGHQEISLDELRAAMLSYIDSNMLVDTDKK